VPEAEGQGGKLDARVAAAAIVHGRIARVGGSVGHGFLLIFSIRASGIPDQWARLVRERLPCLTRWILALIIRVLASCTEFSSSFL
jgi:hypothetical protein